MNSKMFRIHPLRFLFGIFSIGILLFSGAGGNIFAFKVPKENSRIVIYHVNDIHGGIENFAKIARLITRERENNPDVFFLCAGDNFSGNPYVDRSIPRGEPIQVLMNLLGCNVQVLGNHDFDYGQEVLGSYISRSRSNIVCANLKVVSAKIKQPKPYAILETSIGMRIVVLGLVQTSPVTKIPDTNPVNIQGIQFRNEITTAMKYRYLKKKYDIFVALTHMGFNRDQELASRMKELDVIIGGHSHTIIERPAEVNGVLIVQAGSGNRYVGRIELFSQNGVLVTKKAELIELGNLREEDPEVKHMIEKFLHMPELDRVVVVLDDPVEGKTELGNLLTDAIRDVLRLDVAFYNSGGIRIRYMKKVVTIKDVYALDPFDNEVVIFKLKPAEIRSLINYDYDYIKPLDLQVSGLEYTVQVSGEKKVKAIELKLVDGSLLDENKTYSVGMNNYMASAYRFEHQDPGQSAFMKVVDVLIEFLKKGIDLNRIKNAKRAHEYIIR